MTSFEMPKQLSELLLVEVHKQWTMDVCPIASGDHPSGTVLARVAGKVQPIDFEGEGDGPEKVAVGVLASTLDMGADSKAAVIARGAVLAIDELVWPAGATGPDKAGALAQLAALGIVARQPI